MKNFYDQFHCTSQAHCGTCRLQTDEGRAWRESIAKHFSVPEIDFECPRGLPWYKEDDIDAFTEQAKKLGLKSKALKAASEMIGRVAGEKKVSAEVLAERQKICSACEMQRPDEAGHWCGELIRLRFGSESKKTKGCGCRLEVKWQYEKFKCPRGLWAR